MAATTLVMAPATAHADPKPPCYGSSCNGKDAQSIGCAGGNASSVASVSVNNGDGVLTLRYSSWCHANWALMTTRTGIGYSFYVENANGDKQYAGISDFSGWTSMVNGVPKARACLTPGNICTGWK
ncbi:DUF2690 domain-containing protein [Streptomyces sp. NPDC059629]|uniref:DUF2690 domain-containing protein n=1 Tax=Streptomyces sp. NPDC059629 TaxID=3346889 RepID=UPI0036A20562